jgi:hypothetical protein
MRILKFKNHYKLRFKIRQNITLIKILFKKQDKHVQAESFNGILCQKIR